jgi:Ca-activated chloride channel family protein
MGFERHKFMSFAEHGGENSAPQTIMVAMDVSGSMNEVDIPPSRLKAAVGAASSMTSQMAEEHPDDEVGIVAFSSKAQIVHPPVPVGANLNSLLRAMDSLKTGNATNITAGLEAAGAGLGMALAGQSAVGGSLLAWISRFIYEPVQGAPTPRRLARIILISDGHHNTGRQPLSAAVIIKKAGGCIDVIGIGGAPDDVDPRLPQIASTNPDGSPRYCFIGDAQQLVKKFKSLGNRIRPV